MSPLTQGLTLLLQVAITAIGSGVAIWIALYQQREARRREQNDLERQRLSVAYVLVRDIFELTTKIAANVIFVQHSKETRYR